MEQGHHTRTYLALAGAVVFWGLSFVATRVALETLPVFTLIFARFSIAALFFMVITARSGFPKFTRKEHLMLFMVAMFEPGLYFVFETLGLQRISAPKAALIIATIPLAVTLISALFLGERPRIRNLTGVIISLAGIGILVVGDPHFSWDLNGSLSGDLLIIGAVFSASLYITFARNLGKTHSALEITGLQITYGALFFAPGFLWELPDISWAAISLPSLAALAYLTVFATIGAFICYNYALTQVSASHAAMFINCIPVVTALGAWLLIGETLTTLQICGGVIVLLAVFMPQLPGLRVMLKKAGESPA
ncbi:EamA/RhaT family transporter [Desulfonema ishimotonii]|uniref:EamA/RhaT family transporter n=1 Tax=Desulfonema ishimotonii TaxID=45657 RepID=A0A401FX45_9BACT|nr:EamA family transporter [Desulfonema ishimotonii]GBC61535.1 EamA/RhaT family transporter [Desulfonema ishimotonii]